MNRLAKLTVLTCALLACMFAPALKTEAGMGGFSVNPVFPASQDPQTTGYFNLRVTAGQREEISVSVGNSQEEEIFVEVRLITASTNMHGEVDYSSDLEPDSSMLHSFTSIASIPDAEYITIPPGERVEIPITINVPAEGFDGIILGSVEVLLGITEEERAEAGMIVNRFAQVIPIRLQESTDPVAVDFALGDVRQDLVSGRSTIIIEVRNPQPRLSMGAVINASVYPAGSDTPMFDMTGLTADFAPNSVFSLPITDMAGAGSQAGEYRAVVQIEHDGETWNFEQEFTIEAEQAAAVNENAVNLQQNVPVQAQSAGGGFNMIVIIVAAVAVVAAAAGVFLMMSKQKAKQAEAEQSRNKERKRRMEMMGDDANDK